MSVEQFPPDPTQWVVLNMLTSPPTVHGPFITEDDALDYAFDDLAEDYEVLPLVPVDRKQAGWQPILITGGGEVTAKRNHPSRKGRVKTKG